MAAISGGHGRRVPPSSSSSSLSSSSSSSSSSDYSSSDSGSHGPGKERKGQRTGVIGRIVAFAEAFVEGMGRSVVHVIDTLESGGGIENWPAILRLLESAAAYVVGLMLVGDHTTHATRFLHHIQTLVS